MCLKQLFQHAKHSYAVSVKSAGVPKCAYVVVAVGYGSDHHTWERAEQQHGASQLL